MIIVRNIKIPVDADFSEPRSLLEQISGIRLDPGTEVRLLKRSVDARDKSDVHFVCTFTAESGTDSRLLKLLRKYRPEIYQEPRYVFSKAARPPLRPIVVGFGPAGMFASLTLAKAGLEPIVIERGKDADARKADVDRFAGGGALDPESNIQFGEGGAGTFSDGKLFTGIRDPRIREILHIFAEHGAGEQILWDARPHIGTDVLIGIVKSIRREITSLGGEVRFGTKLEKIHAANGAVTSITVRHNGAEEEIPCSRIILALGHSARDTFETLSRSLAMEPKPFAIGARIEHLREDIDRAQYGSFASDPALGAAEYHLSVHLDNSRGVFSFCMCPGGEVLNASSEAGGIVTNGMSYSARDGRNSNAALLVGIDPADFYNGNVLDGMYFQRRIEQTAYRLGKGLPLSQTVGDFLARRAGGNSGKVLPTARPGVTYGDLNELFPEYICSSLSEGILLLDKKLRGFADPAALLTGPETRSSSPVRILRNSEGFSSVYGILPCGEGAGYAGGITSAAADGIKCAEKLIASL